MSPFVSAVFMQLITRQSRAAGIDREGIAETIKLVKYIVRFG